VTNPQGVQSTYEEATRCPKCKVPGQVTSKTPARGDARPGTTVHMVYCRNDQCQWFDTNWVVQVNPDGSVPPPQNHGAHNKNYPMSRAVVPDEDQRVVDSIRKQLEAETKPGSEVRRRG